MTAAIYDTDAIRLRAAQLRGEAPSGRRFERGDDGKHVEMTDHDFSLSTDRCVRCGYSRIDVQDSFAPKFCPGKHPTGTEIMNRVFGDPLTGEPMTNCRVYAASVLTEKELAIWDRAYEDAYPGVFKPVPKAVP